MRSCSAPSGNIRRLIRSCKLIGEYVAIRRDFSVVVALEMNGEGLNFVLFQWDFLAGILIIKLRSLSNYNYGYVQMRCECHWKQEIKSSNDNETRPKRARSKNIYYIEMGCLEEKSEAINFWRVQSATELTSKLLMSLLFC